ncbi:MAG: NAD-dependent epimerase/dehydratase family protein [Alphaproteobacteria bacterium]|nr:NAD-dependent epimerase/dehydratase family protein [Alphaproteobacteria bacterium]
MMRRCLVTGGAGFIGSHLVDHLVAENWPVTVLDDLSTGKLGNLSEAQSRGNVRIVQGSVLDRRAIEAAAEECDVVFHLAVQCVRRSLSKPLANHDVNATGTLNVLEVARRRGVRRFIYCSSSEVYGNSGDGRLDEATTVCEPATVYGAAKLAGEHYAKAYWQTYGLPTIVVRPFNTYGPREHTTGELAEVIPRFVIRVLNGLPPVIFGTGENRRDFTYVTETARGITLAANCDALIGRVVNIAYGKMISVRQVADAIARLCGRADIAPMFIEPRPGDVRTLWADTRLAHDTLSFVAEIDLDQGLRRYIDWFLTVHPDPADLLEDDIRNWRLPVDCEALPLPEGR